MAKILFIHNHFPGRFYSLLPPLMAAGHSCAGISPEGQELPGTRFLQWKLEKGPDFQGTPLAARADIDFRRGRAAANCALQLQKEGFTPDLIIGHPGWGETIFLKEIFPKSRMILVGEYYYRTKGGDVGFDPEFKPSANTDPFKAYAQNATMAMSYAEADRIVFPTHFQASSFPAPFRDRAEIIHEGIDTGVIKPVPNAKIKINDTLTLDNSVPVVTFINRNFEPLRGFHIMMRSLPKFLKRVPKAHVIMIGNDRNNGYGLKPPPDMTWKSYMLRELKNKIDLSRVHFTGQVAHQAMLSMMSISAAHVYYTYPFVLSWSSLEAMAVQALVLGSDTPPLWDAIENGKNGILNNFFDWEALADAMIEACTKPERFTDIRKAARQSVVDNFDQKRICLPKWLNLIDQVLRAD